MLPFLSIWQPYNSVNLCNLARKGATFSVGSWLRGDGGNRKGHIPIGDCSQIFSPFRFSGIVLNANNHSRNLTPARLGVLASKSYTS